MKIYNNITELIGNTPILKANNFAKKQELDANLLLKLEYFNPLSSVKDRIGYAMIRDAEKKGALNKDTTIIEPTSGNTGIALAFVCATLGYKLVLTMPETMSEERKRILKALGATLVLTDGKLGIKGSIAKAEELHKETENSIILQQFANLANPKIHAATTAQEILKDTNKKVDIFISGIGTSGTITGVGRELRKKIKNVKIVAVEPNTSPVLSKGVAGPNKIQGLGAGFVPQVLNTEIYDEVFTVSYEDSVWAAQELAKTEGVLVGISSGAALYAGFEYAKKPENKGKNIVVVLPDTGERYLSTPLFDFE